MILLIYIDSEHQLGGRAHLLDFGSSKSTRVAYSTYGGELLALLKGVERVEMLSMWLTELYQGLPVGGVRTLLQETSMLDVHGAIDANGLFESLISKDLGKITDKGMLLYVKAMRQALLEKLFRLFCWIPTQSMLADSLTKTMDPGELWERFYAESWWTPLRQEWLPEDLKIFDTLTGTVTRWRMEEDITSEAA